MPSFLTELNLTSDCTEFWIFWNLQIKNLFHVVRVLASLLSSRFYALSCFIHVLHGHGRARRQDWILFVELSERNSTVHESR